jgi:hypothetical protein
LGHQNQGKREWLIVSNAPENKMGNEQDPLGLKVVCIPVRQFWWNGRAEAILQQLEYPQLRLLNSQSVCEAKEAD